MNNKVNTVEKEVCEADRAYTAGFLDADGAIMALIEKHNEKKFGFRVRVVVKISQKERDILDWLEKTYCIGHVYKNRTTFDWTIKNQKDVMTFLTDVSPYIKLKKKQAAKALHILKVDITTFDDLCNVARIADALSRLNVRSKNRRRNYAAMIQRTPFRND